MTKEIIEKAALLYKDKSEISSSISQLLSQGLILSTIPLDGGVYIGYGSNRLRGFDKSEIDKIKNFTLSLLSDKLYKIEEEILQLKC